MRKKAYREPSPSVLHRIVGYSLQLCTINTNSIKNVERMFKLSVIAFMITAAVRRYNIQVQLSTEARVRHGLLRLELKFCECQCTYKTRDVCIP